MSQKVRAGEEGVLAAGSPDPAHRRVFYFGDLSAPRRWLGRTGGGSPGQAGTRGRPAAAASGGRGPQPRLCPCWRGASRRPGVQGGPGTLAAAAQPQKAGGWHSCPVPAAALGTCRRSGLFALGFSLRLLAPLWFGGACSCGSSRASPGAAAAEVSLLRSLVGAVCALLGKYPTPVLGGLAEIQSVCRARAVGLLALPSIEVRQELGRASPPEAAPARRRRLGAAAGRQGGQAAEPGCREHRHGKASSEQLGNTGTSRFFFQDLPDRK